MSSELCHWNRSHYIATLISHSNIHTQNCTHTARASVCVWRCTTRAIHVSECKRRFWFSASPVCACICVFSSSCVVTHETFFSVLLFTCLKFNLDFTWQRANVFVFFLFLFILVLTHSVNRVCVACFFLFFTPVISIPNEYWFLVAVYVKT